MEGELERPKWAYAVGTLGGAVFGLGALFLLVQLTSKEPSGGLAPMVMLGLGAAALGVGWIGMFKQGHAGFGAVGGSFLVPIALGYIYKHRGDWSAMQAHGMMLLLAFSAFTVGHCFVRGILWARWLAWAASLVFVFQVIAVALKWRITGDSEKSIIILSFGALAGLGGALAIGIPRLYTAPRDGQSL